MDENKLGSCPIDDSAALAAVEILASKIEKEILNNEKKIIDDFLKTYISAEILEGNNIRDIIRRLELVQTTDFSSDNITTISYFKIREDLTNE